MLFAATQPDRVQALALRTRTARFVVADDYPFGLRRKKLDRDMASIRALGPEDAVPNARRAA